MLSKLLPQTYTRTQLPRANNQRPLPPWGRPITTLRQTRLPIPRSRQNITQKCTTSHAKGRKTKQLLHHTPCQTNTLTFRLQTCMPRSRRRSLLQCIQTTQLQGGPLRLRLHETPPCARYLRPQHHQLHRKSSQQMPPTIPRRWIRRLRQ